jgi:endonuclease/exonuclease/phosphatase family metal-dependent hydrolase
MQYRDWNIQGKIDQLLGTYYREERNIFQQMVEGLKQFFVPTRRVMKVTSRLLFEDPAFWGAGLAIYSRYPIRSYGYRRHPVRTDFEIYTNKGCLWADIELPSGRVVRIMNSHLNDGEKRHNEKVRIAQADQLARLLRGSRYPALLAVDLNTNPKLFDGENAEKTTNAYYRLACHDIQDAHAGVPTGGDLLKPYSFLQDNWFASLKKAHRNPMIRGEGRIDYQFIRNSGRGALEAISFFYNSEAMSRPEQVAPNSHPYTFWRTDHALLQGSYSVR